MTAPPSAAAERAAGPAAHTLGRRRFGRALVPGLAVLAAAAAVAVAAAVGAAPSRGAGPLVVEDDPAVPSAVAARNLHVGESFCYGLVILHNRAAEAATLESVRIQGGVGLTLGPALALGPERVETEGTSDACSRAASALRGYVVPPGGPPAQDEGVEVLLPFRMDRAGKSRVGAVTVTYRSGGDRFEVTDTNDLVACTYACDARPGGH